MGWRRPRLPGREVLGVAFLRLRQTLHDLCAILAIFAVKSSPHPEKALTREERKGFRQDRKENRVRIDSLTL